MTALQSPRPTRTCRSNSQRQGAVRNHSSTAQAASPLPGLVVRGDPPDEDRLQADQDEDDIPGCNKLLKCRHVTAVGQVLRQHELQHPPSAGHMQGQLPATLDSKACDFGMLHIGNVASTFSAHGVISEWMQRCTSACKAQQKSPSPAQLPSYLYSGDCGQPTGDSNDKNSSRWLELVSQNAKHRIMRGLCMRMQIPQRHELRYVKPAQHTAATPTHQPQRWSSQHQGGCSCSPCTATRAHSTAQHRTTHH